MWLIIVNRTLCDDCICKSDSGAGTWDSDLEAVGLLILNLARARDFTTATRQERGMQRTCSVSEALTLEWEGVQGYSNRLIP
jgi:hypothetical protein